MALDRSQGAELWRPMAITTIGGLMSSMILTLLVLPSLIYSVEMLKQRKKYFCGERAPLSVGVGHPYYIRLDRSFIGSTKLPPWVDHLVGQRVNDLLSEALRDEKSKDYDHAIQLDLEAVRLAPDNEFARGSLLRANAKGLEALRKKIEKKRRNSWRPLGTNTAAKKP